MSAWKNRPFTARLGFALRGCAHALASERSFRIQLLAFLAVLVLLWVLRPEALWWGLVLASAAAVFACELLNTAIERLADALHPQDSPAIGIVKDCAAAAVLISCLGALAVAVALCAHLYGAPAAAP